MRIIGILKQTKRSHIAYINGSPVDRRATGLSQQVPTSSLEGPRMISQDYQKDLCEI